MILEKLRSSETLEKFSLNTDAVSDTVVENVHMSPLKIVIIDHVSAPFKIVDESVVGSPEKTLSQPNIVPDVTTSLAQPNHQVETTQENSQNESDHVFDPIEYSDKSQKNMSDDETVSGEKGELVGN